MPLRASLPSFWFASTKPEFDSDEVEPISLGEERVSGAVARANRRVALEGH